MDACRGVPDPRTPSACRQFTDVFCRHFGSCWASSTSPAALCLRARLARGAIRPRHSAAYPGFFSDRDGGCLVSDGDYGEHRNEPPSHHPSLAVTPTGDRRIVGVRLAPARPCRYSGTRHGVGSALLSGALVINEYYITMVRYG